VLIGDGTERPKLEALAKDLGIEDRVFFLGDRTDVPECLSMLDVAVSPSPSESLSNAILEAMAAGLPLVATRTGGTPEVIEDGQTGYLVPFGNSPALAMQITSLLEEPHLRYRMGAAGRARIEQEFAAQHMWMRLDGVYRKMLRKHLPAARIMHIGNFPPPLCGWSIHTLHLHRALLERGADSHVIDIGPNHGVAREGCVPVYGGLDYLRKVWRAARAKFTFNVTVNGDSWKGFVLALMALVVGRLNSKPAILTFRAGPRQMLFPRAQGFWYQSFKLLFIASGSIVCEGEPMKEAISKYVSLEKVHVISPFTSQYMDEKLPVPLSTDLEEFFARRSPLVSSYTLFRPEFEMECVFHSFALLKRDYPNAGLLIAGPTIVPREAQQQLHRLDLEDSVLIAGNLRHAEFLTAIQRSSVFLRSHLRDGVCASVLETLRLGVPVVAVEDGIRPKSVVTYPSANVEELEKTLNMVLRNLDQFRAQVVRPDVPNSLDEEVDFFLRAGAAAQ